MTEYTFILCCIPFFAAAAFHLFSCVFGKERQADISKIILMPLLIAAVIAFCIIRFRQKTILNTADVLLAFLVCAALAAGNAGDIFLLGDVKPATMTKGLCSFLAGHLMYIGILVFFIPFMPPSLIYTLAAAAVYTAAICISWFLAGKPQGILGIGVVLYACILGVFSFIALIKLIGFLSAEAIGFTGPLTKLYIGTLLFLASDSILSRTIFFKPFFQSRFLVMSTYVSAQFFIAWGFCSLYVIN